MSRQKNRWLVFLVIVALTVVASLAAWKLPFLGQWRIKQPAATLVLSHLSLPGEWEKIYDKDPGYVKMWGLTDRRLRNWRNSRNLEVGETVYRFSSPTWATIIYRTGDPKSQNGEYYAETKKVKPTKNPARADEIQYWCAQQAITSKQCSEWFVWMRYGQYIVEISADQLHPREDVEREDVRIPEWLYGVVDRADRALTSAAPRT